MTDDCRDTVRISHVRICQRSLKQQPVGNLSVLGECRLRFHSASFCVRACQTVLATIRGIHATED